MEELELELIDGGAEDIEVQEDTVVVTTALEDFGAMQKKFDSLKIELENAELRRIPNDTKVLDIESAKKLLNMIDEFEDNDDVQSVYHNLEMTDELAEALD